MNAIRVQRGNNEFEREATVKSDMLAGYRLVTRYLEILYTREVELKGLNNRKTVA
jgi:hypothetical protein